MFALMTVNELYRSFLSELENIYDSSEAANISSMVFEKIAGITRPAMIKDPKHVLNKETIARLDDSLAALKMHKPVQYVTGEAWFFKMKLKVSPAVLIPRPETEELADLVIGHLKDKQAATILDIGTGSGCIAIAIKKNIPASRVTAIDISNEALIIAKENSLEQGTDIDFIKLDFLDETTWRSLPLFDVIVSNPPYIPENEKQILDKNVSEFEPHTALFVENGRPLIFYEKIAAFSKAHLTENGKIFLETHEQFAEQTAALFNSDPYSAEIRKDLFEKQRMVMVNYHSR
jgi:release factor glutamine methyltransferase